MELLFGPRRFTLGGPHLGWMAEPVPRDTEVSALRETLEEQGYVRIRGLHDAEKVMAARRSILEIAHREGLLDPSHPLLDGVIAEGKRGLPREAFREASRTPELVALVEAPELMAFFSELLGKPAATFDFKWLRLMGTGQGSGIHADIVYMGRGTLDLYTLWTPLGDVGLKDGPITLLEGSHRLERVRSTYGRKDVDRDNIDGRFSTDPLELVESFGGRWLTGEFAAGDALIFGMFLLHGSLTNETNRFRLSSDTRYQRAGEAMDDRWIGPAPRGHDARDSSRVHPVEQSRREWGLWKE